MSLLDDKVAIVTGAASGIGRATALLFASHGAIVVASDVSDAAQDVVTQIEGAGGRALYQRTDVTLDEDCAALVAATISRFGRLDVAFNNAGISGTPSLTEDQGLVQWRRVIDVNLNGVFNCMVHELRAMRSRGGVIVNTASIAGIEAAPGGAAYTASKHGVIGLTRTAAREYGKHGIRINAVCPGFIATPMTVGDATEFASEVIEKGVARAAIRRLAEPREIAEMVLWLCSDKASFVTGAHFLVDGGVTA